MFTHIMLIVKWNEWGFRPPLGTYRLNWARITSWGWWKEWDDTDLQAQDSKFESCFICPARGRWLVVTLNAFHAGAYGFVLSYRIQVLDAKIVIMGSLRDRDVACLASEHQGSNFSSDLHVLPHILIEELSLYASMCI